MSLFSRIYVLIRQIGTAFIFSLISGGGFLLSLIVFPVIALLSSGKESKSRNVQYCIHLTFKGVTFLMRVLCLVRLKKHNWDKINVKEGQLLISNHPTLIDYVYLGALFPQMDCVVKSELWDNFFLKGVVRAAGYIKVTDPQTFKNECIKRLEDGRVLLIFPEGTRTPAEGLKTFKKGAASLIVSSTCKVQILTIKCSPPILMKSQKWYDVPPKMAVLNITAQDVLDRNQATGGESKLIKAQANVNAYLWNYINDSL